MLVVSLLHYWRVNHFSNCTFAHSCCSNCPESSQMKQPGTAMAECPGLKRNWVVWVPWSSARTASPSPESSQWNWSINRTHGRWCGLGYQTELPERIFQTVWVPLWSLTAIPHRHSSLAPKIRMVIRTHSSPGNALRAPTPVQHKLSFSAATKTMGLSGCLFSPPGGKAKSWSTLSTLQGQETASEK